MSLNTDFSMPETNAGDFYSPNSDKNLNELPFNGTEDYNFSKKLHNQFDLRNKYFSQTSEDLGRETTKELCDSSRGVKTSKTYKKLADKVSGLNQSTVLERVDSIFRNINDLPFIKYAKGVLQHFNGDIVDFVTDILLFTYRLRTFKSMEDLCVCCIEFVQRTVKMSVVVSYSTEMFNSVRDAIILFVRENQPKTEASFYSTVRSGLKSMRTNLSKVHTSKIFTSLRDLILRLIGLRFFTGAFTSSFVDTLGLPVKGTFIDLLASLFQALESLFDLGEAVHNGDSVTSVLTRIDDGVHAIELADQLLLMENNTYSGIPVADKVDIKEHYINTVKCLDNINNLIRLLPKTHPQFKELNFRKIRLSLMKGNLRRKIQKTDRMTPYGIVIHGSPGVGKSSLVEHICKIHSRFKGRKFLPEHMYSRNPSDSFMSGYEPESMPYMHYSELGSTHRTIASKQGDPLITEFLSVCDSLPMLANMPDLESKGNVFVCPELCVCDTNDPEMNLNSVINNPAAVRRRFTYIEAILKPQFRKDGSCELDHNKVERAILDGTLTHKMDIFILRVYKMSALSNTASEEINQFKKEHVDIFEMSNFLYKDMSTHVYKQGLSIDAKKEDIDDYLDLDDYTIETEGAIRNTVKVCLIPFGFILSQLWSKFLVLLTPLAYTTSALGWYFCSLVFPFYFTFLLSFFAFISGPTIYSIYRGRFNLRETKRQIDLNYKITGFQILKVVILGKLFYHLGLTNLFTALRSSMEMNYCTQMISSLRENRDSDGRYPYLNRQYFELKIAFATLAAGLVTYAVTKRIYKEPEATGYETLFAEGQTVPSYIVGDLDEQISQIEKKSQAKFPPKREKAGNDVNWDVSRRPPLVVKNDRRVTNNSVEEIFSRVKRNLRIVEIVQPKENIVTTVLGLKEDFALINGHVLSQEYANADPTGFTLDAKISVNLDDKLNVTMCKITLDRLIPVATDLYLIRLYGSKFRNIIDGSNCLFADERVNPLEFGHKGYFFNKEVHTTKIFQHGPLIANNPIKGDATRCDDVLRYDSNLGYGDCGKPLLLQAGKGAVIAGIHVAGQKKGFAKISFAQKLSKREINEAFSKYGDPVLLKVMSEGSLRLPLEYGNLTHPNLRSPYCYENTPGVEIMGQLENYGVMRKQKSRLLKSRFFDKVERVALQSPFDKEGKPYYLPPVMNPKWVNDKYISPYNNFAKKSGIVKPGMNETLAEVIATYMSERIIEKLEEAGVKSLSPVNLKTAQNGFSKDFYMRSMKNSTSGGFIWKGKKRDYVERDPYEDHPDAVSPNEEIKEQFLHQIQCYKLGEDANPLLGAQLKDEPRSYEKVQDGKTRVFAMSSYESTLVQRMYLLPIYTLLSEHREIFRAAIGVNMHSYDVDDIVIKMTEFSDLFFDGDFGGFDTSMLVLIASIANTIVYNIAKHFGYSEFALEQVRGILSDNLYPILVILGLVVKIPGFQPSGKYATAEDNSLRNIVILVTGWAIIMTPLGSGHECNQTTEYTLDQFWDYVLPWTYGDDLMTSIKKDVKHEFNSINFSKFCKKVLNMKFTAADKSDNLKATIPFSEVSFLKRKFVYRKDLGHWVAPLDKVSIMKTVAYYIPSRQVSLEEQSLDMLVSASREMFFHLSEEEFFINRQEFINLFSESFDKEPHLVAKYFPTFVEIKESIYPLDMETDNSELKTQVHLVDNR